MTLNAAKEEGMVLMKEMNLLDNKRSMVQTMSGGMLRRLSLGIALIGNPKVIKRLMLIYKGYLKRKLSIFINYNNIFSNTMNLHTKFIFYIISSISTHF